MTWTLTQIGSPISLKTPFDTPFYFSRYLSRIWVSCQAINHLQINSYLHFIQFGIDLSPIEN